MISVFTPYHGKSNLDRSRISLVTQSDEDWEWLIGLNGGAARPVVNDARIKIFQLDDDPMWEIGGYNHVGRLKAELCGRASGQILLELDAGDILMPDALAKVRAAFSDPGVHFVYSNDAQFTDDWLSPVFDADYWRRREFNYQGHILTEHVAWPATAHSLRRIEFSPDHLRAWHRMTYLALGGHDRKLAFGDDHDLMCRTYIAHGQKGMKHLDECLYLYHVGDNSSQRFNQEVQAQAWLNYLKYVEAMAQRWATDSGLRCFDLGCGDNPKAGYMGVDKHGAEVTWDLEHDWPFFNDETGVLRAHHVIEHLHDPVHFFDQAYRCLAPGGWLFLEFPQAPGKGAFRDPTHKSFLNEQTLWYFTSKTYADIIRFKGRFQLSRYCVYEMEPSVPVVAAELICLKPPYDERPAGGVEI